MDKFEREGTALAYVEDGAGDPPLVFVHGWCCDHTYFQPQLDFFRAHHRVLAVDLRGHGLSDKPQQSYTLQGFADDVAWVCAAAGVEEAVLIGHSMGGAVVLDVAARYPEFVRAVVMLDAAPIGPMAPAHALAASLSAGMSGPDGAATRAGIIEHAVSGVRFDDDLRSRIRRIMASTPDHVARSCIDAMGNWDGAAAGRACTAPALHVAADEPINDAASLRALMPSMLSGQTVGAGHFLQLEVPEQINLMIQRFLKILGSGREA